MTKTNEINYALAIKMIDNFLKENWITKQDYNALKQEYKNMYKPTKAILMEA